MTTKEGGSTEEPTFISEENVAKVIGHHPFHTFLTGIAVCTIITAIAILVVSSSPNIVKQSFLFYILALACFIIPPFCAVCMMFGLLTKIKLVKAYKKIRSDLLLGNIIPDHYLKVILDGSWLIVDKNADKIVIGDSTYPLSTLIEFKAGNEAYTGNSIDRARGFILFTFSKGDKPEVSVPIITYAQALQETQRLINFLGWN